MIPPEDVPKILTDLASYMAVCEEVQLCDFGESANSGPWVKFRLLSPESLEPYRGQDRSGRNARTGKRYTLMLIAIDDQDQHEQGQDKPRKLSQVAGAVGQSEQFRAWIVHEYKELCDTPEDAATFIRNLCGIDSRAELDTNPEAAKVFRGLLADFDADKR